MLFNEAVPGLRSWYELVATIPVCGARSSAHLAVAASAAERLCHASGEHRDAGVDVVAEASAVFNAASVSRPMIEACGGSAVRATRLCEAVDGSVASRRERRVSTAETWLQ